MPSEHCAPISEQLRESGTNLQHPMILQAARHYCPPHPASLLLRRLFSTTRSTVQLTLGNYSPLSKLCSTLLLLPQLPTSLLMPSPPFLQKVAAINNQSSQLSPSKGTTDTLTCPCPTTCPSMSPPVKGATQDPTCS